MNAYCTFKFDSTIYELAIVLTHYLSWQTNKKVEAYFEYILFSFQVSKNGNGLKKKSSVFSFYHFLLFFSLACKRGLVPCLSPVRATQAQAGLGALPWPEEAQLETSWSPSKQRFGFTWPERAAVPPQFSPAAPHTPERESPPCAEALLMCKPWFKRSSAFSSSHTCNKIAPNWHGQNAVYSPCWCTRI